MFGRSTNFPASLELSGLNGNTGFVINGIAGIGKSGFSVSEAGDVNGDGIDDLIVGSSNGVGQSYVVFGRNTGFPNSINLSNLNGRDGFAMGGVDFTLGRSVSGAGDFNGDGIDDVIVGASFADPNNIANAGESYVVFGRCTSAFPKFIDLGNLTGRQGLVLKGINAGDRTGKKVSGAGDVNGDGFDDLLVDGVTESYLIFGRSPTGAKVIPGSTNGADNLSGTIGKDLLRGLGGNDLLLGGPGNDELFGNLGNDTLRGGPGNDFLSGCHGQDLLLGEDGNDTLNGGIDNDRLIGGNDRDLLFGDEANDTLNGGLGNDTLVGGAGRDRLLGDNGKDVLRGGAGIDLLKGGAANDRLFGDGGKDNLNGGSGNDRLIGGAGGDRLVGGAGNDLLVGGTGRDVMIGGQGRDGFRYERRSQGRDRIQRFNSRDDRIEISLKGFRSGLKTGTIQQNQFRRGRATQRSHRFLFLDNKLFFDPDGSGSRNRILLATVSGSAINRSDIIVSDQF